MLENKVKIAYIKYLIEEHLRKYGEVYFESLNEIEMNEWLSIWSSVFSDDIKIKYPNKICDLLMNIRKTDIQNSILNSKI